jgi:hypothetical protein
MDDRASRRPKYRERRSKCGEADKRYEKPSLE